MPPPWILALLVIAAIVGRHALESYEYDAARWKPREFYASSHSEVAPIRAPRFGWIAGFWEPPRRYSTRPLHRGAAVWRPTRAWAAAAARKRIGS